MPDRFSRQTLIEALGELGAMAWRRGRTIEMAVYGGSALVLTYDWRQATRDVDAVFEADKALVRELAAEVGRRRGWDETWLNDGVKGFLSAIDPGQRRPFATFPSDDEPGLRVMVASPAYLFAMKCRAMRLGGPNEASDVDDIRALGQELGLTSAEAALALVASFFPRNLISPRTQFGLEEIFDGGEPEDG